MVYLYIIFVTSHKTSKNKYQTSFTLKIIATLNMIEFCLFSKKFLSKVFGQMKFHEKGSRNIYFLLKTIIAILWSIP